MPDTSTELLPGEAPPPWNYESIRRALVWAHSDFSDALRAGDENEAFWQLGIALTHVTELFDAIYGILRSVGSAEGITKEQLASAVLQALTSSEPLNEPVIER